MSVEPLCDDQATIERSLNPTSGEHSGLEKVFDPGGE
jgi:hypothetical protein